MESAPIFTGIAGLIIVILVIFLTILLLLMPYFVYKIYQNIKEINKKTEIIAKELQSGNMQEILFKIYEKMPDLNEN